MTCSLLIEHGTQKESITYQSNKGNMHMVMIIFFFNLFLGTFIGVLMVRFHDNYFLVPNA